MLNETLQIKDYTDDTIATLLGYTNPINLSMYVEAYNTYRSLYVNDEELDMKLNYLLSKLENCDNSFIAININTIFKEVYITKLYKLGITVDWDITIRDLIVLLLDIESIRVNDDVLDILREVTPVDCELIDLFHKLDLESFRLLDMIKSYSAFIDNLYKDNFDSIYTDTSEPLELPEVS